MGEGDGIALLDLKRHERNLRIGKYYGEIRWERLDKEK